MVFRVSSLLFLGVGTIARAVRRALPDVVAFGTTRTTPDARFASIVPLAASDRDAIRAAAHGAQVVVSFPPDGRADQYYAALLGDALRVVYLSSTSVYSVEADTVDEASPVSNVSERSRARIDAECTWLETGASVLRLPAFYGAACGLHVSLARGSFRLPGDGSNVVSRVHEDDAARFVQAALAAPARSLLLAGDEQPAPVAEVVAFVCELFQLPVPEASHGEAVPLSLRGSRRVDSRLTRARYDVSLAYPTYREGYRAIRRAQLGLGDIDSAITPGH